MNLKSSRVLFKWQLTCTYILPVNCIWISFCSSQQVLYQNENIIYTNAHSYRTWIITRCKWNELGLAEKKQNSDT